MPQDENEIFHHYQILRREDGSLWELGRGAMGVTYKAIDTNLHAPVALKLINTLYLDRESARERFVREARAAASLRHRNVASVYHLGQDAQSYFYAMEFIDGETVEQFIRRAGPQPWTVALAVTLQVARALMAAHEKGLVHRDIKPANIMLVKEVGEDAAVVKVIDFGLAKPVADDAAEAGTVFTTHTTGFLGTPHYASPEQCDELAPDIRSDIYSLGVTLWFMLTGRPPFSGKLHELLSQQLHAVPPWSELAADVPECVRELLARMLAKKRSDRPQTPADLRTEIEGCLAASGEAAQAVVVPAPVVASEQTSTATAAPRPVSAASDSNASEAQSRVLLDDCLREARGHLPAALVAAMLRPLAAIADASGATPLNFTPRGIWIVTSRERPASLHSAPFSDIRLTAGRRGWLEVNPATAPEELSAGATIVPVRASLNKPIAALAALAYELLSGTPPAPDRNYRPLADCDEAANALLRAGMAGGGAVFPSAAAFAEALASRLEPTRRKPIPPARQAPPRAARSAQKVIHVRWVQFLASAVLTMAVVLVFAKCVFSPKAPEPKGVASATPSRAHESPPAPNAAPTPAQSAPTPPARSSTTVLPALPPTASVPPVAATPAPPSPALPAAPTDVPIGPSPSPVSPSPSPTPVSSPASPTDEFAALLARARERTTAGKWDDAVALYTQALALKPASIQALDERGTVYAAQGEYDKAKADYAQAALLPPADAREHFYRADALGSLEDHRKAEGEYRAALNIQPTSARDFLLRGQSYYHLQKSSRAIQDYEVAIRLDPQNDEAYTARGYAYLDLRKYDEAAKDFSDAIRLNPGNVEAFHGRALIYYRATKYDLAILDFNEAIRLRPKNSVLYHNRALAYYNVKNYEAALKDVDEAIALASAYRDAYLVRSQIYRAMGRSAEAKRDKEAARKLHGS